jgi:broad specificity phosphatase PhoE
MRRCGIAWLAGMPDVTPLAVLRHGATVWNAERRLQGRSDLPLSAVGEATVRTWRLPPRMRHWQRCTSPLARARRTAALLTPAMPARIADALVEMRFGDWEGKTLAELRETGGNAFHANEARGLDLLPPGGESPREVIARLRPWLAAMAHEARPTVAVTHKGVMRALLAMATGWEMREKPPVRLQSAALHLFAAAADGTVRLVRANVDLRAPGVQGGMP